MSRIRVSLSIRTERLLPSEITGLLRVEPDSVVLRGPDRTPPKARPLRHGWFLEIVEDGSRDPVGLLERLLGRVGVLAPLLDQARDRDASMQITFHVAVTPWVFGLPFFFPEAVMKQIAEFGASLDLDFFEAG